MSQSSPVLDQPSQDSMAKYVYSALTSEARPSEDYEAMAHVAKAARAPDPKASAAETSELAADAREPPATATAAAAATAPGPSPAPPAEPRERFAHGFTQSWLPENSVPLADVVSVLVGCNPATTEDYGEHVFKVASLLYDGNLSREQTSAVAGKYRRLREQLARFAAADNPAESRLYVVVEKCFDVLLRIATDSQNIELATATIRYLTTVMMSLNYWEVYNLLRWRPAFYQFLQLIRFDLHECYARFMRDHQKYTFKQQSLRAEIVAAHRQQQQRQERPWSEESSACASPSFSPTPSESALTPGDFDEKLREPDSGFEIVKEDGKAKKGQHRKRKSNAVDAKLAAHRVIKNADSAVTSRSSNYDPDVIHECRLPCPDEPEKLCLRRFSRKYELIRHQETVHSKKKKLFKCFVCVKQDPTVGPRIFTRHDTLAKHIRVNHRISGKEAKAEVAYSKKHAEIVDEGDITVHVGRRKTKVDFELRAHMEKQGITPKELKDGALVFDDIDDSPPDSIQSEEDYEND